VSCALVCGVSAGALAQSAPPSFVIDDGDPVSSVPTPEQAMQAPLEMGYFVLELADRGDAATKSGDHVAAAKYFLALGTAAPDRAVGFSKACESFERAASWEEAADACRNALGRAGVQPSDMLRYVRVMLNKDGLNASEAEDVKAVLGRLEQGLSGGGAEQQLMLARCQLAAKVQDSLAVSECARAVSSWPEDDARRLAILATDAIERHDWDGAREIVEHSEQAGVTSDAVTRARELIRISEERHRAGMTVWDRAREIWPLWLAVLGALAMAAVARSRAGRRESTAS